MEENTVLREDVLAEAIKILEIEGIANTSLEMVAERVSCPTSDLKRFWPDREALLYDALRYLSQQVDAWRRQLLLDDTLSAEQKLLARMPRSPPALVTTATPAVCLSPPAPSIPIPSTPFTSWRNSRSRLRWPILMSC